MELAFEAEINLVVETATFNLSEINLDGEACMFEHDEEYGSIVEILDLNVAEGDGKIAHEKLIAKDVDLVVDTKTNSVSFIVVQYRLMGNESDAELVPAMYVRYTIYFAEASVEA